MARRRTGKPAAKPLLNRPLNIPERPIVQFGCLGPADRLQLLVRRHIRSRDGPQPVTINIIDY